jgi:hypothetical protein
MGGLIGARFGPVASVWLKGTSFGKLIPTASMDWRLVAASVGGLALILIAGTTLRALRAARLDPAISLRV